MSRLVPHFVDRVLRRNASQSGLVDGANSGCMANLTASHRVLRPLSIRKNFGWNLLASGAYAASRWITVIVLAKLGTTEMIGLMLLALAIANPISTIANLGLRTVLVTDTKHEHRFRHYFSLRLLTSLLAIPITGMLVLLLGHESRMLLLILLVAVGRFFESLSDIIHGLFQQHERMDWPAISMLIREPGIVAVLALGVGLTGDLLWGMIGLPLVAGTVLVCYDVRKAIPLLRLPPHTRSIEHKAPFAHGFHRCWDTQEMRTLLRLATPAGIVLIIIALVANLPRYFIEHYLGIHALGVFGAIACLTIAPTLLVVAMGGAISPRLAKYYAARNLRAFGRLVISQMIVLTGMGLGAVLLMALLGHAILSLLYDAQIAAHTRLAVYLTITAALLNFNAPLHRSLDAMRCFWSHVAVRLLGLLLLLALLPPFITNWSLEGAAWAMILSALCTTTAYLGTVGYWLLRSSQPILITDGEKDRLADDNASAKTVLPLLRLHQSKSTTQLTPLSDSARLPPFFR